MGTPIATPSSIDDRNERTAKRGLSVLVVDDDPSSREGMRKIVELLGYRCRTAYDGAKALEMLEHTPADVIISDGRMPRLDGLALSRAVRSRGEAYVYFILVTANDDKQYCVDAMRAGVDEYLTKPIDLDALSARLVCAERVVGLHR